MITTPETKICSSMANPVSPLGCLMYNSAFEHLKLNYVYFAFAVTDLEKAIKGMRALNFRGTTISMPYKIEVMKYLDRLDETTKSIGAVNVVINDNGILTGYNSDWIGAMTALKEMTKIKDKKILVLGAGGAARAIVYGLSKEGAKIKILNRTASKAEELAKTFNTEFGGLNELKDISKYDIVMNATSVGHRNKNESLIDKNLLSSKQVVFDTVISSLESKLIKEAKEVGCKVVPGWKMLLYQAVWNFEKFTGKKTPVDVMEKALKGWMSK
jgi:shikimate dehydrogenase